MGRGERQYQQQNDDELMKMNYLELSMFKNKTWPASMEMPAAANVINSVIGIEKLPDKEQFKQHLLNTWCGFARCLAVGQPDGSWRPLGKEDLDFAYHLRTEETCETEEKAMQIVNKLILEPVDESKPLWVVHLIPCSGGDSILLWRVHHAVSDGVHLAQVIPHVFTDSQGNSASFGGLAAAKLQAVEGRMREGMFKRCCRRIFMGLAAVPAFFSNALASKKAYGTDLAFTTSMDHKKSLRFSGQRAVCLVPPHSAKFVKACKDAMGVSFNDIVQGAAAGAIHRYCKKQGDPAFTGSNNVTLKALVPVMIPRRFDQKLHDRLDIFTNNWCFCSTNMPVSAATPEARVRGTAAEMTRLKNSMRPYVGLWMINSLVPKLPEAESQKTARDLFGRHGLVFSNVPGPSQAIYLCGQKVTMLQSVFLNAIPQAILISYNDKIFMNYVVDPDVVRDPSSFGQMYLEELTELGRAIGIGFGPLDMEGTRM
eukprot:gnl/MRDRNA2_/MRDRNA2_135017_c0_seq1.p1 gnl/MRDRNA2_/MRDRNA2_135017_c0~~gnl/MRDRNA2_/MRDRNA2_135017_c0_seq1.p1  ORF type:complete len:483 (-),score=74.43 gnl/MRDRNA2_/MRDRNA2_135017_c0_seq1:256-1704(-)